MRVVHLDQRITDLALLLLNHFLCLLHDHDSWLNDLDSKVTLNLLDELLIIIFIIHLPLFLTKVFVFVHLALSFNLMSHCGDLSCHS